MSRPWVVLKYGGTSVATPQRWAAIARRVQQLLPDHRVWIVASAVSQVSNRLEQAIAEAMDRAVDPSAPIPSFEWIRDRHLELARGLRLSEAEYQPVRQLLRQLKRLLYAMRQLGEASPRARARVLSFGELASTHLGVAALRKAGLDAVRVEATSLLRADPPDSARLEDRYLEAHPEPRHDPAAAAAAADGHEVVLTQGFIARLPDGDTCLLGRGGSDTSAALFAALLGAERLEIWTDVHGLFTTDPRQIPTARLIRRCSYREAQELAAMGAKVLHPRCLAPAAAFDIPIWIRNTGDPDAEGTQIGGEASDEPAVLAVVRRRGVTLLTLSTLSMWGQPGFLARAFAPFAELGISIDLVATSQSAVSVTLDHIPGGVQGEAFAQLQQRLAEVGTVEILHPCAVVSIVGRRVRSVLHELGGAFSVFAEHDVHLVSESSEDLNLSFVVDEAEAGRLVADLHQRLLPIQGRDGVLGPTWELLGGAAAAATAAAPMDRWWPARREELLALAAEHGPCFVYDLPTVRARASALREQLPSVGARYYAMKANWHPEVLQAIADEGFGIECVSAAEIDHVRHHLGDVPILFTPNFCPVSEYAHALANGAEVTLDGPHLLTAAAEVFAGQDIAVRLDPGGGDGHHEKVVTAGAHAKFGHPLAAVDEVAQAAAAIGARITGLHAHVGSGILTAGSWSRTAERLAALREPLPDLRWIDVGGGLGVVERPGQSPLDLDAVEANLAPLAELLAGLELRIEPGRYLVSEGGVLLSPVTQVRTKGELRFVGLATGMNSLIRPALYGAWHGIHNLSRHGEAPVGHWHVVGPICETGDILGRDRLLPETAPGDVLLIENAGAYGRVMSSSYNLREPAVERVLR